MKSKRGLLIKIGAMLAAASVSLLQVTPVSAVPYITPSDPSYRGISRSYAQHISGPGEADRICVAFAGYEPEDAYKGAWDRLAVALPKLAKLQK